MADELTTGKIRDIEQMPVYQAFLTLAFDLERATRHFSPDFRWLRVQALRSSESVCANMAEGFYSQYSTEYLQSLYRCRKEARETVAHARYASGVGQLSDPVAAELIERYEGALTQLACLISSIERKISARGKAKSIISQVSETQAGYDIELDERLQYPVDC
jgi:four helix bundle protein